MPSFFDLTTADIVILVIVAAIFLRGFLRGALRELFALLALAGGIFAALRYGGAAGAALAPWVGEGPWLGRIGAGAAFVGVWVVVSLIGRLSSGFASASKGLWNRLLAGLMGAARGSLLLAAAVALLEAHAPRFLPPPDDPDRLVPLLRRAAGELRRLGVKELGRREGAPAGKAKEEEKTP